MIERILLRYQFILIAKRSLFKSKPFIFNKLEGYHDMLSDRYQFNIGS
jgi:hypothetical protein